MTAFASASTDAPARDDRAVTLRHADTRSEANSAGERIDPLTLAALAYLLLPISVFAATWFQPLVSIAAVALLAVAVAPLGQVGARGAGVGLGVAAWCAVLATVAVIFSGSSPLVASLPELEMARHRWLYNDLLRSHWPVVLENDAAGFVILRYTLGYWLVPAAITKVLGEQFAQAILLGWASLGVAIFLMMAARQAKSWQGALVFPLIALAFSGLDILGVWLFSETNHLHLWGLHDNWTYLPHGWLVGSNLFGISWTPHHDIPAWLGGSILFRHLGRRWFRRSCSIVCVAIAFWSVFVGAAFAAATALCLVLGQDRLRAIRHALWPPTVVCAIALAFGLAFYLGQDTSTIPIRTTIGHEAADRYIVRYICFVALEFGVLAVLVAFALRRLPLKLAAAISILLVLPLFFVGTANDLVMRGSALPMALVLFTTLEALEMGARLIRGAIAIALLIGAATPFGEMGRLLRIPPTPGDWSRSMTAMKPPFLQQWTARIARNGSLARALGLIRQGGRH